MPIAAYPLALAAALGAFLAAGRIGERPPAPRLAALHGALGGLGLALLWREAGALARAAPPAFAPFPPLAAALFTAALLLGLVLAWRALAGSTPPGALVALHAGLAITAAVVFAALLLGG